jgi:hypothetical protein
MSPPGLDAGQAVEKKALHGPADTHSNSALLATHCVTLSKARDFRP